MLKNLLIFFQRHPKLSLLVIGFLASPFLNANPVDIAIRGKVSTAEGVLPGVNVTVEGTSAGTTADNEGNYLISAPDNSTLVFTFQGYKEQHIPVKKQTVINVTMVAEVSQLDEVIVTGYRAQARGTVIGSVSSVSSSEFSNTPVDNLSNALAGRLAGATITQASGTPGMESAIRIRSQGTFNNASPLFVIDGVVSDKFAFDGLSPNEVENVTILKDGASAAIYGSRAANGVILVTTKRGRTGAPKFTYNGIFGLQQPTKIPETLNAFEHASAINHQLKYIGSQNPQLYYSPDELDYFKTHSWSWIDAMWKDPLTTQHSMDVSGGTANVKYFLGGSYNFATGTFNNIDFAKLNLRGNVDVSITKNLKVSLDINTDTRNTNGPSWDVNNLRYEDLYKALLLRPAMVPPYINGEPVGNWIEWHPGVVLTPSASGYNKRKWTGLNTMVTLNYTVPFIKGLSAKTSINRFNRDVYQKNFNLPYNMTQFNTTGTNNHIVGEQVVGPKARAAVEFLNSRADKLERYQFNAQINYKRNFGKHGIDALMVYEQAEENNVNFNGQRNDFISPAIDQYIGGSVVGATASGSEFQSARISYVGLIGYNYAQKYLLEGSFRYDGSVIFAPENRWGFFPSLSAGWKISSEPFFERVRFIDDLKLRASVGLLGNDQVGNFQWIQSYNILTGGAVFDNVQQGLEAGVLANRGITWEKSLNYNVGLDSRFLKNKMSIKLDAFYRHTYDILGDRVASLPSTLGAALPDENYREIDSKGFEIELGYDSKIGGAKNPISYYIRGNFGYSTNKVIRTNEAQNIRPYLAQTGYNIGRIYGLVATDVIRTEADLAKLSSGYTIMGVPAALGMLNYKDVRGVNTDEPDGKITSDDREVIGRYNTPPINYGLSFGTAWKSLSIDVLLQGVSGGYAMLPTAGRDIQARPEESSFRYWADSWSPENPGGKYPGYRVQNFRTRFDESTLFLMDNSFLRLKNISVSYSLPKGLTDRVGLKGMRVFFNGSNLFMLYSGNKIYDPEMNNIQSYPMMKNYSFGLNLSL